MNRRKGRRVTSTSVTRRSTNGRPGPRRDRGRPAVVRQRRYCGSRRPPARALDQRRQVPGPCVGPLRAGHPVGRLRSVRARLGAEPRPGRRIRPEAGLLLGVEGHGLLLVGEPSGPVLAPGGVGGPARVGHAALALEPCHEVDVDPAPVTAGSPRREADGVGLGPEGAADAVDPAEAQGLRDRLPPGHGGPPGALLVESDEDLPGLRVMPLEPVAPLRSGLEEDSLPHPSSHHSSGYDPGPRTARSLAYSRVRSACW